MAISILSRDAVEMVSNLSSRQAIRKRAEHARGDGSNLGVLSVVNHLPFCGNGRFHGRDDLVCCQHPVFYERQHQAFNQHQGGLAVREMLCFF
jgi:hypothetical protein